MLPFRQYPMKASFYNIGCKVNFAELSEIESLFRERGFEVVPFGVPADVVIINTCTVTGNADADSRKMIRRARASSPAAFIGVTGCYAQLGAEDIKKIDGVDAVFGSGEKFAILDLIDDFSKKENPAIYVAGIDGELPFHSACSLENESRTRVALKLQDGCDYKCTYCTIPQARGCSRSMATEELEKAVRRLDDEKKLEVVLTGINLGEYSYEGKTFFDVLAMLDRMKPGFRSRISSIEPNLVTDEIIGLVAGSEYICPHFHIPLQSGSDHILRLMKRRYNTRRFAEKIESIKAAIPDCCIGVDVITGFPGEEDVHFNETYELLRSLPISYLHVFSYSMRKNTPAAGFEGKVAESVKKERTKILRELSESKKNEFYQSQLGKMKTIVPERYSAKKQAWTGWTGNYVFCSFRGLQDKDRTQIIQLEEIRGDCVTGRLQPDPGA